MKRQLIRCADNAILDKIATTQQAEIRFNMILIVYRKVVKITERKLM